MNILQIADHFGPTGGLERFIYEFTIRLGERGIFSKVAVMELDGRHDWGETRIDVSLLPRDKEAWEAMAERFRPDLIVWHAGPETAGIAELLSAYAPVAATVHRPLCPSGARLFRDADEICVHPTGAGCLFRWYARKCGTNVSPLEALRALKRSGGLIGALRGCGRVYAVSRSMSDFLALEGIDPGRLCVIDNSFDDNDMAVYPPLQRRRGEEELELLYVGRINYTKGVQYLLRAVRRLLDDGHRVRATIVGDGWFTGKMRELALELGLQREVVFTGHVNGSAIDAYYDRADLLVVPSVWPEPAGLVVPEARRRGKPVVVFDAGGLSEWQAYMDGVYTAKHADIQDLAETILAASKGDFSREPASQVKPIAVKRANLIEDLLTINPTLGKEAAGK
ncbi:glycosyltransferase family 4 protein [Cohnella rhizosphaerae]|uniref:Glycosyltransferase family 4 protein n=1 Tax=Cohnella rhizosphaerae TaxID=1457232 RepID=A0A9X4L0P9_9BACL|nr:glycosyltransferase family 4 protein [Cohnella rhizosphaerae]MDG0814427.1 glycosyltransferase family 4 protein [Cohnella rhizosphaerae]